MMLYLKEGWRSLVSTKQRTLLALIGIVIGIGSVIALVSIGQIVAHEATRQFRSLGTDIALIDIESDAPRPRLKSPKFLLGLVGHTHCIRRSAPFIRGSVDLPIDPALQLADDDIYSLGVTADFLTVARLSVQAGRFISDLDEDQPYVVLGAAMPRILGLDPNSDSLIGQEVVIGDELLQVVGLLKPTGFLGVIYTHPDTTVFRPALALAKFSEDGISTALARMAPDVPPEACVNEIENYVGVRSDILRASVVTADELIAQMREQADLLGVLLAAVGSISLMVGGVGIMNIMLVSVTERKQEIGIRRALGARRRDIRYQFLTESLLLSAVGGIIGILASVGTTWLASDINQWQFFISPGPILLGAGVSLVIGVFFGYLPAHQAANLDPIEALQSN